jgi:hypothetical protein
VELGNGNVETIIEKARNEGVTKTRMEIKIGKILGDLSYVFEENMVINGTEIDFLINKNIILEFNGMFHYKINSRIPKLKKY